MNSTPSLTVSQYSPAFITRRGISARSNNLVRRSELSELLPLSPVERNILSGDHKMKKLAAGYLLSLALISSAYAATTTMKSAPAESWTVTNYYKQAIYDPKETKIGDIDDVLVDKSGKITGLVLGVGGFLAVGEKDVIVPFTAVKTAKKNEKWWLTLDETKDELKNAPGFKYDKASTTWVPEKK
jgi:sporulation protein YlmC with PRC-barrel domain